MKSSIGETFWFFLKTNKEFKKLGEVEDADEIIHMKKHSFEAWSTMVFMRGSAKRKYGELIHDFSIRYAFKNNQYPKTLQEAVGIMRQVKFKSENNNDKINTQKNNKNGGGERDKSIEMSFAQTQKHEKSAITVVKERIC